MRRLPLPVLVGAVLGTLACLPPVTQRQPGLESAPPPELTQFTVPGATFAGATGISDGGVIVGFAQGWPGGNPSFLTPWVRGTQGQFFRLPTPAGSPEGYPTAIQRSGGSLIVGIVSTECNGENCDFYGYETGILWRNNTSEEFNLPAGALRALPADVNSQGYVVGTMRVGPDEATAVNRAFVYATRVAFGTGTMTDLGTLPGGGNSEAMAVNTAGDVVGCSDDAAGRT